MTLRALLAVPALVVACSSKQAPPKPLCCPPSPSPACCMRLGGVAFDGICPLTCDVPDPNAPGWKQVTDPDGCLAWQRPVAPFACSAPPIDASPDVDAKSPDVYQPCLPTFTSQYVPSPLVPTRPPAAGCTQADLGAFYDACVGSSATNATCNAWVTAATPCDACLLSNVSDATWSAVVVDNGSYFLNVPGCVALVQNDASATSCAARLSASWGCQGAACQTCGVMTALDYEECYQLAAAEGCRSYADAECDPIAGGFNECIVDGSKATVITMASVFCPP